LAEFVGHNHETDCDGVFQRCPSAYLLHVANKMTATVPAEVLPRRRGVFEFDRISVQHELPVRLHQAGPEPPAEGRRADPARDRAGAARSAAAV
jgi:hypothetical protein